MGGYEQGAFSPICMGLGLSKYQCVNLSLTNLLIVLLQIPRKLSFVLWLKLSSLSGLKLFVLILCWCVCEGRWAAVNMTQWDCCCAVGTNMHTHNQMGGDGIQIISALSAIRLMLYKWSKSYGWRQFSMAKKPSTWLKWLRSQPLWFEREGFLVWNA